VTMWDAGRTQSWTVPGFTTDIDLSRDGRSVASSSADGIVRVWDAASGQVKVSLAGPPGFTGVEFSPTGDALLLASREAARIRVWSLSDDSAEVIVPQSKGRDIYHASFDPNGERIVYAAKTSGIVVHEMASGREVTLGGAPKTADGAWFSRDGDRIVGASRRGIAVWRVDRPERPERVLEGHRGTINELSFSSGGRFVTAGADRTARVWDPTGGPVSVMRGHENAVTTAVFTADGKQVLTSSWDGTLRLFDARTGVPLAVLESGEGELYDAGMSSDGKIATLGRGEVVRVFDCDICGSVDRVRALALSRSPRPLTAEERRQFLALAE
jgi:WD40 repeat protein